MRPATARQATVAQIATIASVRIATLVLSAVAATAATLMRSARAVRSAAQATVATVIRSKVKLLTLSASQAAVATMARVKVTALVLFAVQTTTAALRKAASRLLALNAPTFASIQRSPRAVMATGQPTQATVNRMVSMLRILMSNVLSTLQRTAGVALATTQAIAAQMGEPIVPTPELELISLLRALPALNYLKGVFLNAADEGTKLPYIVITATHAPDVTLSGEVDADHITFTITAWGANATTVEGIIDLVVELLSIDTQYEVLERTAGFDEATGDDAAVLIADRWITT